MEEDNKYGKGASAFFGQSLITAWLITAFCAVLSLVWSFIDNQYTGGNMYLIVSAALGIWLSVLAVIDINESRLPNSGTIPLVAAGLVVGYLRHPELIYDHLLGAAAGYLILAAVARVYASIKGRDGMGLGDAKLFAAAGAWLAWQGLASVLLIGSLAALVFALLTGRFASRERMQRPLPFGPFLALGVWIVWLYGPLQMGSGT